MHASAKFKGRAKKVMCCQKIACTDGIPNDKPQKDWKSRLRGERDLFFTNIQSGTPARRQVTLENCVYSGQGGGMIYVEREIGLKVSVITTIREAFNWVCCNINDEGGGVTLHEK